MLFGFVVGFLLGFVTSVPVGASGQLMINRSLRHGFSAGLPIGLFSALLDAIYCELALVGISLVINSVTLRLLLQGGGLLVLLAFGYRNFWSKKELFKTDDASGIIAGNSQKMSFFSHLKYFPVVFISTVSNPTMLAFWVNVAQILRTSVLVGAGIKRITLFSAGVGSGSALCQYVVLQIVHQAAFFHNPKRKLVIERFSAFVFALTIAYFIFHFFRGLL